MTISVLIVAHNDIGQCILKTVRGALGTLPIPTTAMSVSFDTDPDLILDKLKTMTTRMNSGDGVLVLTDLYGSTPSNIAGQLGSLGDIEVVSGLNMPMLVRIMNYPDLPLAEIALKAIDGGKSGIRQYEHSHYSKGADHDQ